MLSATLNRWSGCRGSLALLVAMLASACLRGLPRKWGLLLCSPDLSGPLCEYPISVGAVPASMLPTDYKATFDDLAKHDLSGQTALVTGANQGLGYWTALHLSNLGAHVMLCCRSEDKCEAAAASINNTTKGSAESMVVDLSSLASTRALAESVKSKVSSLDMLVLNAAILETSPPGYAETEEGIEVVWATNHVGHFLLFKLLLPLMESGGRTGASRVVSVSSGTHYQSGAVPLSKHEVKTTYKTGLAPESIYYKTKAANVLFALEAARRLAEKPVYVNSLNPGVVGTNFLSGWFEDVLRGAPWLEYFGLRWVWQMVVSDLMWSPEEGALTQLWLASASSDLVKRDIRGKYFHPQMNEMPPGEHCQNATLQEALWDWTEELVRPFAK